MFLGGHFMIGDESLHMVVQGIMASKALILVTGRMAVCARKILEDLALVCLLKAAQELLHDVVDLALLPDAFAAALHLLQVAAVRDGAFVVQ